MRMESCRTEVFLPDGEFESVPTIDAGTVRIPSLQPLAA